MTVTKAYDSLENESFTVTIHGKGAYITAANAELLFRRTEERVGNKFGSGYSKCRCYGISDEEIKSLFELILEEMMMLIRQETSKDYDKVYDLIKLAFKTAEHSDGNEQDLTNALRESSAFVPELSLVAEIDREIVGHILFTEGKVGSDTVLVLAPLSVSPNHQKKGIGTALMAQAHKVAKEMGYQYSLVLGSEHYYPRAGYVPAEQFGIEVPEGIPNANFMAVKLAKNTQPIQGSVTYAKEFGM